MSRRRPRPGSGGSSGSNRPTFTFHDPAVGIPYRSLGQTNRLSPVDLLYDPFSTAIGMCDPTVQWRSYPLPFPPGRTTQVETGTLLEKLGHLLEVGDGNTGAYFQIPSAAEVFTNLQLRRRQWLHNLRQSFQSIPDRMYNALLSGRLFANAEALYAAHLAVTDMLLLYVSLTYNIRSQQDIGWRSGLAMERQIMLARLPDPAAWHPRSRQFFARFTRDVQDVGGFVVPGNGAPQQRTGQSRPSARPDQPQRLYFSMSLPAYVEPRVLVGANIYRYLALIFTPNPDTGDARVGVDTVKYGHRFIGLEGDLDAMLQLASALTITALRQHPNCKCAPSHDDRGRWQTEIRGWLQC